MPDSNARAVSTQQAYDRVAADFAARTIDRSSMAAEFFDRFVASLHPGSLVADLGCGPGHDVRRLIQAGHRPVGIDRSAGLLGECPTESSRVMADLRSVPVASGSVDGLWSSAALLHVDRAELGATFAEWNRIVRPGGVVGFATSLGDDQEQGWELVPAAPHRIPEISPDDQRWFVHHDEPSLRGEVDAVGWLTEWSAIRSSHRDWLQLLARKPRV